MRILIAVGLVCACAQVEPVTPSEGGVTGGGSGGSSNGGGAGGSGGGSISQVTSIAWKSGSRLKAKTVSDDGAAALASTGWFDSALDMACIFVTAADGQLRCVPWLAPYAAESMYSDAACTQPVLSAPVCGSGQKLALRYDTSSCATRYRVFRAGAPLNTRQYFYKSGTTCSMQMASPDQHLLPLGAELSASELVGGTVTRPTSGVGPLLMVTPDGATGSVGMFDATAGADCSETGFRDGYRCTPTEVTEYRNEFTDSMCTTAAYTVRSPCGTKKYTRNWGGGGGACERESQFGLLGSAVSSYHYFNGAGCWPGQAIAGVQAYTSSALPASTFPAASLETATIGRLQRRVLSWPGGAKTFENWRDTQLDADCYWFYAATDGTRRCIPQTAGVSVSGYYANAACTEPIAFAQGDSGCQPKFALGNVDSCAGRARSYRVGARFTGSMVFTKSGASCTSSPTPTGWTMFRTGAEVAPNEMAPLLDQPQ